MILCFRPVKEYGWVLNKECAEQGMYLPWGRPVVNGGIVIDMNQLCEQVGKRYGTNRNQRMNGAVPVAVKQFVRITRLIGIFRLVGNFRLVCCLCIVIGHNVSEYIE